jgi:acetaldehyde dehydrogenase/alcohol dehydrogenase
MWIFDACPKIYFGAGALDCLDGLPVSQTMLVADPYMVKSRMADTVTSRLEARGVPYSVFSDIEPDPSVETVAEGVRRCFRDKPDVIIALGGGSAIDVTKAILYFCLKSKAALMDAKYIHRPVFVAIPTTSGTGSEMTSYSVLTDRRENVKIPLADPCMTPDIAVLCPAYTETLPKDMVAYTGMDVLTHAVEAYVTKKADALTDMYAREAAHKVFEYLETAWGGADRAQALGEMMLASMMAGVAFNNSGLGVCHGLAHCIGAMFHIPHGKANSIILPYTIAFNAGIGPFPPHPQVLARYAKLCRLLGSESGFTQTGDEALARRLVQKISELNRLFGVPEGLNAAGISHETFFNALDDMARRVLQDMTTQANPVEIGLAEARLLLKAVYEGKIL